MRYQGRITTWKDDRGFGFITPNSGEEDIFVHIKDFSARQRRPVGNEIVTYERRIDDDGRIRARNVAYAGGEIESRPHMGRRMSLVVDFLCAFAASAFLGFLPIAIVIIYLVASLVAFSLYAIDKYAARQGMRRTPERRLHLLSLLGGWPGALIAQRVFRHKTAKVPFQRTFWITVSLNCIALGWLLSPWGTRTFESVTGYPLKSLWLMLDLP